MSVATVPLDQVQQHIGRAIDAARKDKDMRLVQVLASMAEYLKDAERWQFVREDHDPSTNGLSPTKFTEWVDEQIRSRGV